MEETVQVLLDEDALVRDGLALRLTKPLNALKIPPTVQGILAARIDRLSPDAKELLQSLAVIGREFPLSLIRAVVPKSDEELDRLFNDLQLGEFIYEQPAVGDTEYIFKHALTQEVAYNSLLIERRKQLHERAGEALESIFAEQLDDHLDELAHHYSRSDNTEKAVEYLGRAGQQALQRSAYADAAASLTAALNLLERLPDGPARIRRELFLQLALGPALNVATGSAVPEVEHAYARARELCELLGDPPELFPALLGLWLTYLLRGELRRAFELAEQLLRKAQSANDPMLTVYAQMAWGAPAYWMGEFREAREHLESALPLYDPDRHRPLIFRYTGTDAGIVCLTHAAWALWQLGYPDQALRRGNEALAVAQKLSHPFSLAFTKFFVGILHQLRREPRPVQDNAEDVIALSAEQGFSFFATSLRGWALAEQGHKQEGIAQIQEGLTASRLARAEVWRPYFLTLLAAEWMESDRFDDGVGAVTEALATAEKHENHHNRAEIHRLRGELVLRQSHFNSAEARSCFERALEIARQQSAKSWELRATMSLARLLAKQGHRDEARTMLADIYNWFTEGFDTADLKDAKMLLDELST